MAVSVLLTFCVASLLYLAYRIVRWIRWYRKYFKFFNSLPGETDFHWIWGNIHKLPGNTEGRLQYVMNMIEKNPKFFRMWASSLIPIVQMVHPDTVKVLLKSAEPKPRGIAGFYQFALPWLGEGLLLSAGSRWARSRRLLTPAFHFDILRPYVSVYNQAADILLSKIDKFARSGESFELFSLISLCTLDIILRCAMSYQDDIQLKGDTHPYVQAVNELANFWSERARNPALYLDFIYFRTRAGRRFLSQCDYVHSVAEDIIKKRRQSLEKDGTGQKKYLDFLDLLLTARDDQDQGLTPLEIRNEVDTFLFEGHDTTASATSWILYSLASLPEHQERVQAELDQVMGENKGDNLDTSDLAKLEYLSLCIKEGMRLHCPVPFIQRQLTRDAEVEGYTLPAGTVCSISIMGLHHNPLLWADPWEFHPDRFLSENIQGKDSYLFVPFSAGPRNCIGQHFAMNEEKVLLGRILHKYKLEVDPNHEVKRKSAAVMRAENGIKVFAKPRFPSAD